MSKERLEEIKEEYKWHVENQLLPRTSDDNFEWLIEQTERVQELERANKQLKNNLSVYKNYYNNTLKHNKELIEQNKRYREFIKLVSDPWEVARKIVKGTDKKGASAEEIVAWIEIESEKLLGESE